MNNKILLQLTLFLAIPILLLGNDPGKLIDFKKEELKTLMFKVADWQNEHTEHIAKYKPLNWHLASYYIGLMEMYKVTGEQKYYDQLFALGEKYNWATEERVFDADRIAIGQMYLDVFAEERDPKIIEHLKWVLDAHIDRRPEADVRFEDNPYRREWWTWCDALFMAPPTFAKMYETTGEEKYLDYAIKHWLITTDYLLDKQDNLIYRDDRFFDQRTSTNQKVYWSRGNGWVFGGLVHMLNIIPKSHPQRATFETQFKEMAATLAEIQNSDGMWRPSLMDEQEFSQPETSGSAFFCYGMLWGINNGILPKEKYETCAVKAWKGLKNQVNEEGRLGHVQPPGIEPKPFDQDAWHEYGTGAFLLAGSELLRILEKNEAIKGELIYQCQMSNEEGIKDWKLEGPATIKIKDGWMDMFSPNEEGHHVFWCPEDFPEDFIAEWELQNIEPDAGLCIVFFSALGINGKDIFDPSIKPRDGVFRKYTKSDINCYHISYYANGKDSRAREVAHLRKNAGFHKVQIGDPGIPVKSTEIHKMKLVKKGNHITMSIDEREIVNWLDDGNKYGPVLGGGKIGLRQMKWTHFRYRNFKVWNLKN